MRNSFIVFIILFSGGCVQDENIVKVDVEVEVIRSIPGLIAEEFLPDIISPLEPIADWRHPQQGVREIIATEYDYKGEVGFKKKYLSGYIVTTLDENGNVITILFHESDDFISYAEKYSYTEQDLTIKTTSDYIDELSHTYQYQYEDGLLQSMQEINLSGTNVMDWYATEFRYEDDVLIGKNVFDTNGNILYAYEFDYDYSGNLTGLIAYEGEMPDFEIDYKYTNDILSKIIRYNSDGEEVYQYTRSYNDLSRLNKETFLKSDLIHDSEYQIFRIREYNYRDDGQIDNVYYHDDLNGEMSQGNIEFSYDSEGILTNEMETTISGEPVKSVSYDIMFYDWIEDAL